MKFRSSVVVTISSLGIDEATLFLMLGIDRSFVELEIVVLSDGGKIMLFSRRNPLDFYFLVIIERNSSFNKRA